MMAARFSVSATVRAAAEIAADQPAEQPAEQEEGWRRPSLEQVLADFAKRTDLP